MFLAGQTDLGGAVFLVQSFKAGFFMGKFSSLNEKHLSYVMLDYVESTANDRSFIKAYLLFGLNSSTPKLLTHELVFVIRTCTDV